MPDYKNKFESPTYIEESILDGNTGNKIGTIRIKLSSISWKPKGQHKFYYVSTDDFARWITDSNTNAERTSR
jgi:hypothetical protein